VAKEKLLKLIIGRNLPFNIVEDENFRGFVKSLNQTWGMQSRDSIVQQVFSKTAEVKAVLTVMISEVSSCAITTDCWTSSSHESYIAVTCHYIDIDWKLHRLTLECSFTFEDFNNPLEWWKGNEKQYPLLARVARKVLAIPATSASSERVFSAAGLV
jgi:hypothetical protein